MPFRPQTRLVAAARLAGGYQWVGFGRRRALRRRPLHPRCAGARAWRGAACADLLPDTISPFPVKGCSSGRESGSLRLPGWAAVRQWAGFGALEARRDVDRCLPAARARASGEERLVTTSSRILFHLFPVKDCRSGREPGPLRQPGGQRLAAARQWAPERAATSTAAFPRRRALVSGEERLVPTTSRILFRLSRLMVAVPAANLVRCG